MTELALPPAVDFGYVVGQFMPVIWDTPDPDRFPGGAPAVGKVTFTPLQRVVRTPAPNPMTVLLNTVTCNFDTNGRLIDSQQAIGVWLVVGQWRVSYDITGHQLNSHDIEVTNFNTEAEPLDLTTAAPPEGPPLTGGQYAELKAEIDALVLSAGGVLSVNGATGNVVLNAASVGALPSSYTPPPPDWTSITSRPTTFPPSGHTHEINQINGLQQALDDAASTGGGGGTADWNTLLNKPATFPPSTHSHAISEVTGLQAGLDGKAPSTHSHAISGVTGLQAALDGKVTPVIVTTGAEPRPANASVVMWIGGTAEPTNSINNDIWLEATP